MARALDRQSEPVVLNDFQQRVVARLGELDRDAFEAARRGNFSDRRFVYDITIGRKASVQTSNAAKLARALDWTIADLTGEQRNSAELPPPDVILPPPGQEISAPRIAGNRDVEVRGISVGGDDGDFSFNGEVVDYVSRPAGIERRKGVFAVRAVNDSMYPAYEPHDAIYVDGLQEPNVGDDVIVEMMGAGDGEPGPAYLKRLVRRSGSTVVVEQFNPAKEIEFERGRIRKLWRVIPRRELLGL